MKLNFNDVLMGIPKGNLLGVPVALIHKRLAFINFNGKVKILEAIGLIVEIRVLYSQLWQ